MKKIGFHVRMDKELHKELLSLKKLMEKQTLLPISLNDFINFILRRELRRDVGKKSKAS
jgi:hypothetical protein